MDIVTTESELCERSKPVVGPTWKNVPKLQIVKNIDDKKSTEL